MLLTDSETKVDLLNNEAIATTIVELIRSTPECPVTIGVHGDWGAGKSSVLEMIETKLDDVSGVLCLKFNGWRFQGFEDAKIALIEGIVTGLVEKRPALTRAADAVRNVFRRIDWLKVAKKAGGLALTAYTGIPTPDQIQAVIGTINGVLADPAKLATKANVEAALEGAKSLLKPESDTKNVPEEIGAFRKAFDELLEKAGVSQLVVLIDDLDRCLPETAIETLEAVRLFVFTSRTAFVVAADEAMIEYAVRKHFPDLPDTTGPRDYARNYLEKLIQVPFRLPALGEAETRIYVTLLLIGADVGETSPGYDTLLAKARALLARPWTGGVLDASAVNAALGAEASKAQTALTLSDQIGPLLAAYARGNPRQIKRFLNTLLLRQRIAAARGFGDDVKLPVLGKLMLAERFLPRLFDQLASAAATHPSGQSDDVAAFEAAAEATTDGAEPAPGAASKAVARPAPSAPAAGTVGTGAGIDAPSTAVRAKEGRAGKAATPLTTPPTTAREVVPPPASATLAEWLASPPILAWARVRPALAGVDLRPYLFVAKDRKDYFGAASALGHLATVVEQLLGPKFGVQALGPDLKQLAVAEAARVFEALRGRIVGSDSFETEPAGVPGLTVLVRAHPTLQGTLVDFLEALPRERLGAWAVSGWEGVLTDPAHAARFARLLNAWATAADTNLILKAAAAGVLRTRTGGR